MAKAKNKSKRAKKKPVILPMKMSALIKVALKDIRRAERTDKIVVDMSDWFNPDNEVTCQTQSGAILEEYKVCTMCAAGSVMAFTLGALKRDKYLQPDDYPKNEKQLYAINDLRGGGVSQAAMSLGLIDTDDYGVLDEVAVTKYRKLNRNIPDYDRKKPEPFHKAMGQLQAKLEKAGL